MIPALAVASGLCMDDFTIFSYDASIADARTESYKHNMC